jgi:hypothetical protein
MDLPYLVQINMGTATRLLATSCLPRYAQVLQPSLILDHHGLLCLLSKSVFWILDMTVDLTGFPLGPNSTACRFLVLFLFGCPLDHLNLLLNNQIHLIAVNEPAGGLRSFGPSPLRVSHIGIVNLHFKFKV